MPSEIEMLRELHEMVKDDEIVHDECLHLDPSGASTAGQESDEGFCPVCFIENLYTNTSDCEPYFSDETSERQRETIFSLWSQYCDENFFCNDGDE